MTGLQWKYHEREGHDFRACPVLPKLRAKSKRKSKGPIHDSSRTALAAEVRFTMGLSAFESDAALRLRSGQAFQPHRTSGTSDLRHPSTEAQGRLWKPRPSRPCSTPVFLLCGEVTSAPSNCGVSVLNPTSRKNGEKWGTPSRGTTYEILSHPQRRSWKKAARSCATAAGSSAGAKCPPRGKTVHR